MKNNSRGMTLIEIIIAVAVSSVLVLGITRFATDMIKLAARSRTLRAVAVELRDLRQNLSNPAFCAAKLRGAPFNPTAGIQPLPAANVAALDLRFETADDILLPLRASFQSAGRLELIPIGPGVDYEMHKTNLRFDFQTVKPSVGGQNLATRIIPIRVMVNRATNQVVNCQSEFGDVGIFCTFIGGVYNEIQTPPCKMPVFVSNCPAGEVVGSITPGGFNCHVPPVPPSGAPTAPSAPPSSSVYLSAQAFGCWQLPPNCTCPRSHPMQMGGSAALGSVTCVTYATIPPTYSYAQIKTCVDAAPFGDFCLRIGTDVIRPGFGPCDVCP